ncbi:hypothetical protein LYNGBM3L_08240 [Moorena producens 3L]|uniref:Uncharacterized protein n=1 Tax=Moorena producens 3L TaxID=489825 RepID=F4XJR4_9CYAN|nr:hypothetical protein LYNGBM3L_08240 [Moorena producens 3L]
MLTENNLEQKVRQEDLKVKVEMFMENVLLLKFSTDVA